MPIKVYKVDFSPPVGAVKMICEIFKVPVEYVNVDLMKGEHREPEYLKLNPLHTVPVMVDGDIVLQDSHAILMYLAEVYGNNDPLYPNDVKQRALINQKLFFNNAYLFPRLRNVTNTVLIDGIKGKVEQKKLNDIEEAYSFMEEFLNRTKYLAGDNLTIADIAVLTTVFGFKYILPIDAQRFPKLTAWLKELEQKPYSKKFSEGPAKVIGEFIEKSIKEE